MVYSPNLAVHLQDEDAFCDDGTEHVEGLQRERHRGRRLTGQDYKGAPETFSSSEGDQP